MRESPRSAVGPARWGALLLLAVLAWGFAAWRLDQAGRHGVRAEGDFWSLRDADGELAVLPPAPGGLPLRRSGELWVDAPGPEGSALRALALYVAPGAEPVTGVEIALPAAEVAARVRIAPQESPPVTLSVRRLSGEWRPLLLAEDAPARGTAQPAARPGARGGDPRAANDAAPPSRAAFRFAVTLTRDSLALRLDDQLLREVPVDALGDVPRARLRIDDGELRRLSVDSRHPDGGAGLAVEDFALVAERAIDLQRAAAWLEAAMLTALCAGWLLTRGPPRTRRGWLRAALGLTVLAYVCGAGADLAEERARAAREAWELERATTGAAPWTLDAPLELHAGNVLEVPGERRDLELTARVVLEPGALLETRLRAGGGADVEGVALLVGDRGRYGAGWVRFDHERFELLDHDGASVPVGRPLELALTARGDRFAARVGERPPLEALCRAFDVGGVQLLAVRGRVRVESLVARRPAAADAPLAPAAARLLAAGALALGALLLAWGSSRLLATPFVQGFAASVFCWVPVALACEVAALEGGLPPRARWMAAALTAFVALLHVPSTRGVPAHVTVRRGVWLTLIAVALPLGALLLLVPVRDAPSPADSRRLDIFPGPRLTRGLVAYEHPAVRAANARLRRHEFRGLEFAPAPPPDTLRVLTEGSSSTVGYGLLPNAFLDYPALTWRRLRRRFPERGFEVLNGAVSGGSIARQLRIFEEDHARFAPDVVTLCLGFNDARALTELDEHAYLARLADPARLLDPAARAADAAAWAAGRERWHALSAAFEEHGPPTRPLWDALPGSAELRAPPDTFAAALRAWSRACDAVGARLVLVKEPVRGDAPVPWLAEFRAAMDEVAAELDLLVVDPTPALLAAGPPVELFMDVVHPTPAGHAVIADVLTEALADVVPRVR